MAFDRETVEYIANLSRLALSEREIQTYQAQLEKIVQYVDQLQALDTRDVAPLSHPLRVENVFREDVAVPSLPVDQAIANGPDTTTEAFKVPQVLD